jgi:hypothetical protein
MAEIHFRSMEASQNKSDATIQFLVGGLLQIFIAAVSSHYWTSSSKVISEIYVFYAEEGQLSARHILKLVTSRITGFVIFHV